MLPGPALGLLELCSIARGMVAADGMAKRAPVKILESHPVSPGKFVIVISGEVADVEESMAAGMEVAAHTFVDRLFLPQAHPQVHDAMTRCNRRPEIDSVGIVETFSVAATVLASDAAVKAADVFLLDMQLGQGLGGKAFFTLTGELHMVEAALAAARGAIEPGLLLATELIPAPHADLRRGLIFY
jgi:microcompartment protein CcmL/EutN